MEFLVVSVQSFAPAALFRNQFRENFVYSLPSVRPKASQRFWIFASELFKRFHDSGELVL